MTRHEWHPTIERHRRTSDALARATGALDVGRQRPSMREGQVVVIPPGCIRTGCGHPTAERSDFCNDCLTDLKGNS